MIHKIFRAKRMLASSITAGVIFLLVAVNIALAIGSATVLISRNADSGLGTGNSNYPTVSESGLVVAFSSRAEDLGDDGNGFEDVYLYDDRVTYPTNKQMVVSQNPATGDPGNGPSRYPFLNRVTDSPNFDGRYVVFQSDATNLVSESGEPPDNNSQTDIYLYQSEFDSQNSLRVNARIWRVSLTADGQEANGPSGSSGVSPTNPLHPGAGVYYDPANDTPVVVFESAATNLVPGDTNGKKDIFRRFMDLGSTPPSPTAILLTRVDGNPVGALSNGDSTHPVVVANPLDPSCQFVAFVSTATNLVTGDTPPDGIPQIYLLDTCNDRMYLVSRYNGSGTPGNGESRFPAINVDLTNHRVTVAFHSLASNLVDGDTNNFADIYVFSMDYNNLADKTLERVSVSTEGVQGNAHSFAPALGYGGRLVAFTSYANNFVGDDTNFNCAITFGSQLFTNCADIFVHDRSTGQTWRSSLTSDGLQAAYNSSFPTISGSGRFVYFPTYADLRTRGAQGTYLQIFRRDQGRFAGNPVLKPSSWYALASVSQPAQMVFEMDFTEKYTFPMGVIGFSEGSDPSFTKVGTDTCSNAVHDKGDVCTFTIQFTADGSYDYKYATLVIPLPFEDDRGFLYAALRGRSVFLQYMPLIP